MDTVGPSQIRAVRQTSDGGYIMAGSMQYCFNCSVRDALIIKTDAIGDTLWTRIVRGSRAESLWLALETKDGNYLFAGSTTSFGTQANSLGYGGYIFLVKTNTGGDTLWTRVYGGTNSDNTHSTNLHSIKETQDSGLIMTAGVNSGTTSSNRDILLIRTKKNGDTLWTRSYGTPNYQGLSEVLETADGGLILSGDTGWTDGFNTYTSHGLVVKTDTVGNIIWQKTYGGNHDDHLGEVEITDSGDYIVCGNTTSFNDTTKNYCYVLRLNNNGDTVWAKAYGPVYNTRYLDRINDSTYLLTGLSGSANYGMMAVKFDGRNGNILLSKEYGSTGSLNNVCLTSDGGFMMASSTIDFGSPHFEGYVIKADANGNSGCYEYNFTPPVLNTQTQVGQANLKTKHFPIYVESSSPVIERGIVIGTVCTNIGVEELSANTLIYPNPAADNVTITFQNSFRGEMELLNILGKSITTYPINGLTQKIDLKPVPAGPYFLRIRGNNSINTYKLLVQHE